MCLSNKQGPIICEPMKVDMVQEGRLRTNSIQFKLP
jgi:hypothetical protein